MAALQPWPQTHRVLVFTLGSRSGTSRQGREKTGLDPDQPWYPSCIYPQKLFPLACLQRCLLHTCPALTVSSGATSNPAPPAVLCSLPHQNSPLLALWTPACFRHCVFLGVWRPWKELIPLLVFWATSRTVLWPPAASLRLLPAPQPGVCLQDALLCPHHQPHQAPSPCCSPLLERGCP